jgi:NADPH:quinone reductase-like Zn-dependent oxidoreductase
MNLSVAQTVVLIWKGRKFFVFQWELTDSLSARHSRKPNTFKLYRLATPKFHIVRSATDGMADAWNTIIPLLQSGAIKPIVAKTFPLAEAAEALRCLVEGRPFGRVALTI